jgi:hypothetical protein
MDLIYFLKSSLNPLELIIPKIRTVNKLNSIGRSKDPMMKSKLFTTLLRRTSPAAGNTG